MSILKILITIFIYLILSTGHIRADFPSEQNNEDNNTQTATDATAIKEGSLELTTDKSSNDEKNIGKIIPVWKDGEKKNYKIVKTRKRIIEGQSSFNYTANIDIEIKILKALEDGYRISWKYGKAKLNEPILEANPLFKKMNNLLEGYEIVFDANSDFTNYDVKNWQEIKEKSEEMLNALVKEMRESGIDNNTINTILSQISMMFSSKEQFEMLCLPESQLFFVIYGLDFTEKVKIEYEDSIQNPLGGEPFPTKASFTVQDVNTTNGTATIIWEQNFDKDKAGKVMDQTIKNLALQAGADDATEGLFENVIIKDEAEFVFDINKGWPLNITHKRISQIDTGRQEEIIKFIQVK